MLPKIVDGARHHRRQTRAVLEDARLQEIRRPNGSSDRRHNGAANAQVFLLAARDRATRSIGIPRHDTESAHAPGRERTFVLGRYAARDLRSCRELYVHFSNYWTANLYFRAPNGTLKRVPQVNSPLSLASDWNWPIDFE
ncbi:hypothetical protein F5B18DRAFT_649936 [Nemania serpens]|nr:hypothetical protein F5B18DRAFT_649936 [Nemania serpens]